MLAREYFIYHKQCHKHHKYMLYVLLLQCTLTTLFVTGIAVFCVALVSRCHMVVHIYIVGT